MSNRLTLPPAVTRRLLRSMPRPVPLSPAATEAATFFVEYVLRTLGEAAATEAGRGSRAAVSKESLLAAAARRPGLAFLRAAFDSLGGEPLAPPSKRAPAGEERTSEPGQGAGQGPG